MPRYLTLLNFTDQGIRNIKDSTKRAKSFRESVEAAGGKVLSQYWSMGDADGSVVFEAPDEATGASILLSLAKSGNVRTRTMPVYDAKEFEQVLSKV